MTVVIDSPIMLFDGFVESASLNLKYGINGSTCQIGLAYEGDGPKRPPDVETEPGVFVNPFEAKFPPLGTAVGFKAGGCEFVGLFQRYSNDRSTGGYKWDLSLESPAKLLSGIQIILDVFQGTPFTGWNPGNPSLDDDFTGNEPNEPANIWNPFAVRENYDEQLRPNSHFGKSGVNSIGFPALDLLELIEEISRGDHDYGNKAKFADSEFSIDLSELRNALNNVSNLTSFAGVQIDPSSPIAPRPEYIRVNTGNGVRSLGDIIEDLCSLIMHDFVVVLEPANGAPVVNGVISDAVIKIKLVNKSAPPDPTVIKRLTNQYERQQRLVSANIGKELNDAYTQKLVIGGPASRYYVANSGIQIWGKDHRFGTLNDGSIGRIPYYVDYIPLPGGTPYFPDNLEARCALSSKDTWILYHLIKKYQGQLNPTIAALGKVLFSNVRINSYVMTKIGQGKATVNDLLDTSKETAEAKAKLYQGQDPQEALDRIYNAIVSAAQEYYRRKYMVALPMEPGGIPNNVRFINEDQSFEVSWDIAPAAWHINIDSKYPAGYSEDSGIHDPAFYDDSGRLKSVVRWDPLSITEGYLDYSQLGSNYCLTTQGLIASTLDIEEKMYWLNDQAYAIVTVPSNIDHVDSKTTEQNGLFVLLNTLLGVPVSALKNIAGFGAEHGPLAYGIAPDRLAAHTVGVPQVSNRYTWGPWWSLSSKKGKAEVIVESSLTPETYGSAALSNQVGHTLAAVANAEITGQETGRVELAELPTGNIAERFAVSGPYVTGIDISLGTGGVRTAYSFQTWTPQFGKLAKYNIDRLASINKSTINMIQGERALVEKLAFPKPIFKETPFRSKNMRSASVGMVGVNFMMSALKTDSVNVQGGSVANALGPLTQDYQNSYGGGQEGVLSPAEISKTLPTTSQTKPQFLAPTARNNDTSTFFDGKHVGPTSKDLNPYYKHAEHDFQYAVGGDSQADSLNLQESSADKVRVMGLRGPLILSGWGYDVNDRPVPAGANKDQFIANVAKNRNLWKTGPVDLKWDEERKVWSSGVHIVEGLLESSITAPASYSSPTTFTVKLLRGGSSTLDLRGEKIQVKNRDPGLSLDYTSSLANKIFVIAIRINYEWRPLWVSCPDDLS